MYNNFVDEPGFRLGGRDSWRNVSASSFSSDSILPFIYGTLFQINLPLLTYLDISRVTILFWF